jgi:hypothetical protein
MILEVNGRSLQNLSLLDAHQIFRGLQPGNVTLSVKRKQKNKVCMTEIKTFLEESFYIHFVESCQENIIFRQLQEGEVGLSNPATLLCLSYVRTCIFIDICCDHFLCSVI